MLIVVILIAIAAAGWNFSSTVLVPDRGPWSESVAIEAVTDDRIALERSDDTTRPGYYGLSWEGGHAVLGPILRQTDDAVTRQVSEVTGYLVPGLEGARLDSNVYAGDPGEARGLPFSTVAIDGELGPMPAWLVPGRRRSPRRQKSQAPTWAIVVHGINDTPQVGLRIAPALHRLGLTTLLITYRDDQDAPESPDGFHHMGLTEWRDLEAAARYALTHGARRLVLVGYSMGGALVTQFLERSPLADRTAAIVLDAPALDWRGVLEFNAERMGFPGFAALPVEWAIGARIDVDWDALDALQQTDKLHYPTLLFHGEEDEVVPIQTSEEFARALPGWVTFFHPRRADHTQSWNVNPALYERRLARFLLQNAQIHAGPGAKADRARPGGSGSMKQEPAATYSPRRLPSKYHRR